MSLYFSSTLNLPEVLTRGLLATSVLQSALRPYATLPVGNTGNMKVYSPSSMPCLSCVFSEFYLHIEQAFLQLSDQCLLACLCAYWFASLVSDCAMLWTVAHQAPLSMGFSRPEYWSGLLFPPPGDLSNPGIKPTSLTSPALAGGFFTTSAIWEAPCLLRSY